MSTHNQIINDALQLDLDCIFTENGEYIDHYNKYTNIESINIALFRSKTHPIKIGNGFLRDCSNLESIDLSHFSNVTSIGNSFLRDCSKLESINLPPFTNVSCFPEIINYAQNAQFM